MTKAIQILIVAPRIKHDKECVITQVRLELQLFEQANIYRNCFEEFERYLGVSYLFKCIQARTELRHPVSLLNNQIRHK